MPTADDKIDMNVFKPSVFVHATYDSLKVDDVVGKSLEAGWKFKKKASAPVRSADVLLRLGRYFIFRVVFNPCLPRVK